MRVHLERRIRVQRRLDGEVLSEGFCHADGAVADENEAHTTLFDLGLSLAHQTRELSTEHATEVAKKHKEDRLLAPERFDDNRRPF